MMSDKFMETLVNQLPMLIMLSGGNVYVMIIMTLLLPLLKEFNFTKISGKNMHIPKNYVSVELQYNTIDSRGYNSVPNIASFIRRYYSDKIDKGTVELYSTNWGIVDKVAIKSPIIYPNKDTIIRLDITKETFDDLRKRGLDTSLPIHHSLTSHPTIYIESVVGHIIDRNKKGTKHENINVLVHGHDMDAVNSFLVIVNNIDTIETACSEFSLRKYVHNPFWDDEARSYNITVKKTYDNVFLSKENEGKIKTIVSEFVASIESNVKLGIPPKLGLLFSGVPGCGKSSLVYAIANHVSKHIHTVPLHKTQNDDFVYMIRERKNDILVFDDIDCHDFTGNRCAKDDVDAWTSDKKLSEQPKDYVRLDTFLDVLDGYCYLEGCIVIMTTNHIEKLDPAIVRPGRIDHIIDFDLCDEYQFANMFKYYTGQCYQDIDPDFKFQEGKYTTSHVINTVVVPNRRHPNQILEILSSHIDSPEKNET